MKHEFSADHLRKSVGRLSDVDLARVHYCYQIGSTFVACSLMEDAVIAAMEMCSNIRVSSLLGDDAKAWERLIEKRSQLRASTLGTLIKILGNHGVHEADMAYLKWVKAKRDFFVHRYLHDGFWPGDMAERHLEVLCRRLGALEILFQRAAHRIWEVLERAGLIEIERIAGGRLAVNPGALDSLKKP